MGREPPTNVRSVKSVASLYPLRMGSVPVPARGDVDPAVRGARRNDRRDLELRARQASQIRAVAGFVLVDTDAVPTQARLEAEREVSDAGGVDPRDDDVTILSRLQRPADIDGRGAGAGHRRV